ncbi:MAG: DNA-binding protein WhiA [Synergistaceae bacterium]|nr:DNA-binding protein WhiA [Synergistaceae bacterium]
MRKINTALWDELLGMPVTEASEELSGFLAVLPAYGSGGSVMVDTRRLVVAHRMLKLCKGLNERQFNGKMASVGCSLHLDKEKGRALFRIPGGAYGELAGAVPARKKGGWLRGAFGGCGAVYLPQQGYYMAFRTQSGSGCGAALDAELRSMGLVPRVRTNGEKTEYVIRDFEGIATSLAAMGLVKTSLLLEETAMLRSVKGIVNKRVNCDSANIEKSLVAARAQMELVDALDKYRLWRMLSPDVAELAALRRANPSASLSELGQIMSKPVSKSTVKYRWRKLESLIEGEEYI